MISKIKFITIGFFLAFSLSAATSNLAPTFHRNVFGLEYVLDPIQGKCAEVAGINGHGWKIDSLADYFGCDRLQRKIGRAIR
jgi:hypothetical protein